MAVSAQVQAVLDAVAQEKTETASLRELVQQLFGLIANADDLPALQQTVADLQADSAAIDTAIKTYTPPGGGSGGSTPTP